nr:ribonuclease H-like domain-containing protein [Tanacetum cinerariifolium]
VTNEGIHTRKGVRQGDPLSPFLFILAAEGLNATIKKAVEKGIFRGVKVGESRVMIHIFNAPMLLFPLDNVIKRTPKLLCVFSSVVKKSIGYRVIKSIHGVNGRFEDSRVDGGGVWHDIIRIEEKILHVVSDGQETLWNKLLPKEVNIFMWRALKEDFCPTPQGLTPTDPSPSPQSTLPTLIAHNHASGPSTSAHRTSQLPPPTFDFPNPQPNTKTIHEPPRTHLMITRSQSGIIKPIDRLSLHTFSISPIPKNPSHALKDLNWRNAMYDEYNALVKNGTWLFVPRPAGVNMVCSMWLFKHKFHANGTLSRYKARLVDNGSSQQLGVDFDETFSPVVKPTTMRTVISLAVSPSCSALLQQTIGSLNNEFDMTDLEALKYFLGISADRTPTGLFLSQKNAEAEYQGVANVVAETAWLRNLLRELHSPLSTATLVYCDNVSAVYMSANHVQHQRTKHIEIDIHFVRDMVTAGQVRVLHTPSRFQYVDIFTKGPPFTLCEEFRSSLSVRPPPAPTAEAY